MQKFDKLTGVAAPLPMINIDTDMIIPKQFLKTIKRTGLGKNLFDEMRYTPDGAEIPDFVLNRPAYRKASVLIGGANFGCGSSRETAPYSEMVAGVKLVVAKTIEKIYGQNCRNIGLLTTTDFSVLERIEPSVDRLVAHVGHHSDYRQPTVGTAVAKGVSFRQAVLKHALRNSLIPLATYFGQSVTVLVGGSFLVEFIFDINGMGLLGYTSVVDRDYPTVMGVLLISSLLLLLGHILADVLVALVDPRIRFN